MALAQMRADMQALYDQQERMMNDLAVFNIKIPENQDLKRLEKELQTLEEVWDLADQWEEAWLGYKAGSFWLIKTDEMEELAGTLFRFVSFHCEFCSCYLTKLVPAQALESFGQTIERTKLGHSGGYKNGR